MILTISLKSMVLIAYSFNIKFSIWYPYRQLLFSSRNNTEEQLKPILLWFPQYIILSYQNINKQCRSYLRFHGRHRGHSLYGKQLNKFSSQFHSLLVFFSRMTIYGHFFFFFFTILPFFTFFFFNPASMKDLNLPSSSLLCL